MNCDSFLTYMHSQAFLGGVVSIWKSLYAKSDYVLYLIHHYRQAILYHVFCLFVQNTESANARLVQMHCVVHNVPGDEATPDHSSNHNTLPGGI